MADQEESAFPVNIENEYDIVVSENLPNHSESMKGRSKFVRAIPTRHSMGVIFRTKQEAYRFCAHVLHNVQVLPDEEGEHTLLDVQSALAESLRQL